MRVFFNWCIKTQVSVLQLRLCNAFLPPPFSCFTNSAKCLYSFYQDCLEKSQMFSPSHANEKYCVIYIMDHLVRTFN
jgi:hypothetical protein